MGLDVDYIAGKQAIEKLEKLLSDQPHGEREKIADEIIELVDDFIEKYKRNRKVFPDLSNDSSVMNGNDNYGE